MEAQVSRGQVIVIAIIAIVLVFSALSIISYASTCGTQKLRHQVVRFALNVIIAYFLYKGHVWAKWVMGVLLVLGALLGLVGVLTGVSSPLGALIVVVMSLTYIIAGGILLASSHVSTFMESQKKHD